MDELFIWKLYQSVKDNPSVIELAEADPDGIKKNQFGVFINERFVRNYYKIYHKNAQRVIEYIKGNESLERKIIRTHERLLFMAECLYFARR